MNFKTVFDVAHQGYTTWWFPAFGLLFLCFGAVAVFKPALIHKIMPYGVQGVARTVLSWFMLIFALLWTLVTFVATFGEYRYAVNALNYGRYQIIEGPVTDFFPMPYEGHSQESFMVGGHHFSYSNYKITAGFHNAASHGGPIREGLHVRVSYVGNLILRLEVAE